MRLRIVTPTGTVIDALVCKLRARAPNPYGAFGILPRHADFVTALAPSVISWTLPDDGERYAAIDEGVLVKQAEIVTVTTRKTVLGDDLFALRDILRRDILDLDDHERLARSALARLEAGVVRRFVEWQSRP